MRNSVLPRGIKTIIIVNFIASIFTLLFWILVLIKVYISQNVNIIMDKASKASTLGFLVSDLVWAVPMLVISVYGLKKLSSFGWLTAQFVNILWMYSLTSVWRIRDIYVGVINPGDYLFLPFLIFSIWAVFYLWKKRKVFNIY